MMVNWPGSWNRRAVDRNWRWVGLMLSPVPLTSANLTRPGSRQPNTSKNPASRPPLAARRFSKISAAQPGAPASLIVRNPSAGNHAVRSSLAKAETQTAPHPSRTHSLVDDG